MFVVATRCHLRMLRRSDRGKRGTNGWQARDERVEQLVDNLWRSTLGIGERGAHNGAGRVSRSPRKMTAGIELERQRIEEGFEVMAVVRCGAGLEVDVDVFASVAVGELAQRRPAGQWCRSHGRDEGEGRGSWCPGGCRGRGSE